MTVKKCKVLLITTPTVLVAVVAMVLVALVPLSVAGVVGIAAVGVDHIYFQRNELSRALAIDAAEELAEERFGMEGAGDAYKIDCFYDDYTAIYEWLTGERIYHVSVSSVTKPDNAFTADFDWKGELTSNDYTSRVTEKGNVASRVRNKYACLIENIDGDRILPGDVETKIRVEGELLFSDITRRYREAVGENSDDGSDEGSGGNSGFLVEGGALITFWDSYTDNNKYKYTSYTIQRHPDALDQEELINNHMYDVKELGATNGHITVHVETDNGTVEHAAEIMRAVKAALAAENIGFYTMDLYMEPRKNESIEIGACVTNFLASDLAAEDLVSKIDLKPYDIDGKVTVQGQVGTTDVIYETITPITEITGEQLLMMERSFNWSPFFGYLNP